MYKFTALGEENLLNKRMDCIIYNSSWQLVRGIRQLWPIISDSSEVANHDLKIEINNEVHENYRWHKTYLCIVQSCSFYENDKLITDIFLVYLVLKEYVLWNEILYCLSIAICSKNTYKLWEMGFTSTPKFISFT